MNPLRIRLRIERLRRKLHEAQDPEERLRLSHKLTSLAVQYHRELCRRAVKSR